MDADNLKHIMNVTRGLTPADLIIKNAKMVNVFTRKIEEVDVAVAKGIIARVSPVNSKESGRAAETIDAQGKYMIPGLIDAHSHIEMSFMSAAPFAEAVLPYGTTAAMFDMHDICNVGINCMHNFAREIATTPIKAYLMIPPCVPATPTLEDAGAEMTLKELQNAIKLPGAYGVAEAMDFIRILSCEPEIMSMLAWARQQGLRIDGHCPELRGDDLQAYLVTGVLSDHESTSLEEMLEKYRLGMKVILRRGSMEEPVRAGEFVDALLDTSNVLLATDGCIFLQDILEKGHMNYALRQCVNEGVEPIVAVQMATINVARAYGLDHKFGSIAPGRCADIVLVDNLKDFNVLDVFADGKHVPAAKDNNLPRFKYPTDVLQTVKLGPVSAEDFKIRGPLENGTVQVNVIGITDGLVTTGAEVDTVTVCNGDVSPDTSKDLLKVAVFDRYREKGVNTIAFVRGFGLKSGAFAGSIGQDSQNLVVVGTSDEEMALAVNAIREQQGGVVVAEGNSITARVELPIGGIMSDVSPYLLKTKFDTLHENLKKLGCNLSNPSFSLSLLLTCAVIPELKMTNRGLVDVASGKFLDLFTE